MKRMLMATIVVTGIGGCAEFSPQSQSYKQTKIEKSVDDEKELQRSKTSSLLQVVPPIKEEVLPPEDIQLSQRLQYLLHPPKEVFYLLDSEKIAFILNEDQFVLAVPQVVRDVEVAGGEVPVEASALFRIIPFNPNSLPEKLGQPIALPGEPPEPMYYLVPRTYLTPENAAKLQCAEKEGTLPYLSPAWRAAADGSLVIPIGSIAIEPISSKDRQTVISFTQSKGLRLIGEIGSVLRFELSKSAYTDPFSACEELIQNESVSLAEPDFCFFIKRPHFGDPLQNSSVPRNH